MVSNNTNSLPDNPTELARWFAEGVRSELEALEKTGGTQNYEVISGELINTTSPTQAIFRFIVADGTRIPEEANGRLKTATEEYAVTVVAQQSTRIHLQVEGRTSLPTNIPRAKLIIDDTALLRRLAEILEEIVSSPSLVSPLATLMFHPGQAKVSNGDLPDIPEFPEIEGETRQVLKQAYGSSLTYIWGPPGTGKTYTLAHLIAAFVNNGERVLVTSHTNVAVDQALYEAVKPEIGKQGPLYEHPLVRDGKVLRVGRTEDKKIPPSVQLANVLESKTQEIGNAILESEAKAKPIAEHHARVKAQVSEWDKLTEFSNRFHSSQDNVEQIKAKRIQAEEVISNCKAVVSQRITELEKAQRAWFWRAAKIERATEQIQSAESKLRNAETVFEKSRHKEKKERDATDRLKALLAEQQTLCERLPSVERLRKEFSGLAGELESIEEKVHRLQDEISQLEQKLISEARVIFCTLTKNYIGKELEGQKFDVVIADEISMALPPLLFLVAGRATSRVVLIGDFLQLPPIIRSDSEISNARLRKDAFHLAGVAYKSKPVPNCSVLTKLSTQHRMVPEIAHVARHLVYRQAGFDLKDHKKFLDQKIPGWLNLMPENPLLIVDTADLHCWSGKQPGSLSRFNLYSATVAVELAAMFAGNLSEPASEMSQPIGIVTPYAAQRRLLTKFVNEMELGRWVWPGTVHTFQGGEAELIIFDSVLDEPYWSSRLSNPGNIMEVLRDLNVAVTRAKYKFVFIGSSEWLNKHAKHTSGLGKLWAFLKDRADLLSAVELVELGFMQRLTDSTLHSNGWRIPSHVDGTIHEVLDENNFYERFANDITSSRKSIFGLVPYFGEYRWPRIQPLFSDALARGVEVTLITPPLSEAQNRSYVERAIKNLRELGAIIISSSGLHGKDIVIDEKIHYTGSLNWASHRGRTEIMHRTINPIVAKLVLDYMQAKYIRAASTHEDGTPRVCPYCGWQIQIVNQKRQHARWDFQAVKVGCTNPDCKRYLRDLNERPPYKAPPRCKIDGKTKYRRVRRGRGEVWQCPKHPKKCPMEKVVPGDP